MKRKPTTTATSPKTGRTSTPPARTKLYLTYPSKLVKEPLIYSMSQEFDLVFNIRGASVNEEIGIIALELDGTDAEIARAIGWFRDHGVTVEPIEKNIIE